MYTVDNEKKITQLNKDLNSLNIMMDDILISRINLFYEKLITSIDNINYEVIRRSLNLNGVEMIFVNEATKTEYSVSFSSYNAITTYCLSNCKSIDEFYKVYIECVTQGVLDENLKYPNRYHANITSFVLSFYEDGTYDLIINDLKEIIQKESLFCTVKRNFKNFMNALMNLEILKTIGIVIKRKDQTF